LEAARAGPHDNKNTDEAGDVAAQRRRPTFSPSKGIEKAVMNIGAAKLVAVASAMGKKRSEEMNRIDEVTRARARNTWSPGLRDRSTRRGPP